MILPLQSRSPHHAKCVCELLSLITKAANMKVKAQQMERPTVSPYAKPTVVQVYTCLFLSVKN